MDFTYDAAGNLLSAKDRVGLGTSYAYDALGRRTSQTDANGDATLFTYDRVGNLLSLTDPEDNTTSWEYDWLDRVTQEANELEHSRYFTYDAVGNLTRRIDRNGRVIEYAYDDGDRMTTESWFADVNDATADREIEFTYDLLGRLFTSSDVDHESIYVYERRDLDVATTVLGGSLTGLETAFWFYNEYDAVGNRTYAQVSMDVVDFVNTYGEVLWALTDHLGTVRDIVNNSATVVDHAEYNAFGKRLDPAAVDVVFGFTGRHQHRRRHWLVLNV